MGHKAEGKAKSTSFTLNGPVGTSRLQTGYMQGAAGIGMLFLQMDAMDKGQPWTLRLPDSPFGEKA